MKKLLVTSLVVAALVLGTAAAPASHEPPMSKRYVAGVADIALLCDFIGGTCFSGLDGGLVEVAIEDDVNASDSVAATYRTFSHGSEVSSGSFCGSGTVDLQGADQILVFVSAAASGATCEGDGGTTGHVKVTSLHI